MLGLLLCAIAGEWLQPGVISQSFSSLVVRNDRTYKESPANFFGQLLITLFRIGTIGMCLCLCLESEGQFSFTAFWAVCGLILLAFMAKMLCNLLIDYTFALSRHFGTSYEHYGNLLTLAAVVLYPILLVLVHFSSPIAAQWSLAVTAALFCLVWTYRCLRTYITSFASFIYLIIYICTLEIMPFAGLAIISAKTIAVL